MLERGAGRADRVPRFTIIRSERLGRTLAEFAAARFPSGPDRIGQHVLVQRLLLAGFAPPTREASVPQLLRGIANQFQQSQVAEQRLPDTVHPSQSQQDFDLVSQNQQANLGHLADELRAVFEGLA